MRRVDLGEVGSRRAMAAMDRWRAERMAGAEPDRLFLLSHPPVVTYTARTHPEDLPPADLVELIETDRGRAATHHGPGQVIGYLVAALHDRGPIDVVRWVELALIGACATLGFEATRRDTPPGGIESGGRMDPGR